MKKNKNLLHAIVAVAILLGLAILFVKPIEGLSWNPPSNGSNLIRMDYPGNDLAYNKKTTIPECKNKCRGLNNCAGIVTDFSLGSGPGQCWVKSKFENPTINTNRYPSFLTAT